MTRRKEKAARRERFQDELAPLMDGLHRTASRLTRNAVHAEDLLQDAILKAYRFFDSFKPGTNFRAWMYRVLYTVFINRTRRTSMATLPSQVLAEVPEEPTPLESELARPTHSERVGAVLESVDERIKAAVEELPTDLRMVFLLSTVEGLKYREIAEVMECPLGTVMSRLFRSRRMLQDQLSGYAREMGFMADEGPQAEARP